MNSKHIVTSSYVTDEDTIDIEIIPDNNVFLSLKRYNNILSLCFIIEDKEENINPIHIDMELDEFLALHID